MKKLLIILLLGYCHLLIGQKENVIQQKENLLSANDWIITKGLFTFERNSYDRFNSVNDTVLLEEADSTNGKLDHSLELYTFLKNKTIRFNYNPDTENSFCNFGERYVIELNWLITDNEKLQILVKEIMLGPGTYFNSSIIYSLNQYEDGILLILEEYKKK